MQQTADTLKPEEVLVKQPTQQKRENFLLFCSVVLNAQYRDVQEGISVYSSWAAEAGTASDFYEKNGEKDRNQYHTLRTLAFQKGYIKGVRRNIEARGKPIIKVKYRDHKKDGLSLESYMRLTYSGLAIVKHQT